MKWRKGLRAAFGVALCIAGFVLARATPYRETSAIIGAEGCRLVTDVYDQGNDDVRGYVVLFHGLSANKKLMAYLARGWASQNLRVFVPDFPGHGQTAGPFSFARAEACGDAFVRDLIVHQAIDAHRTMLAGHSMGGAIALRVASQIKVAGVVAISPAPQRAAHGLPRDMLPFDEPPPLPARTLAITGAFEPLGIQDSARDLIAEGAPGSGKFLLMPGATHVSVLFDPRVVHAAQDWTADSLHFAVAPATPSMLPFLGASAGLAGILLLAGPFVRETLGMPQKAAQGVEGGAEDVPDESAAATVGIPRACLEVAAISFATVGILRFWEPLAFVRLFNGSYFASFLLIAGIALLLMHHKWARGLWPTKIKMLLLASIAALALHLLVMGWLTATVTEAWISWARWARFPVLLVAAFVYLLAEEGLLGPATSGGKWRRLGLALTLRAIAFVALVFGIFVLHSGTILLILLALYLAVFFVLQRLGMDLVRRLSGSAIAAALFGAILLAGFCLVIFPVT